jgi:hypothetical protein
MTNSPPLVSLLQAKRNEMLDKIQTQCEAVLASGKPFGLECLLGVVQKPLA